MDSKQGTNVSLSRKDRQWRSGRLKQLKVAGQSFGRKRATQKKSSKNMQRVNKSLLNIKIHMLTG